MDAPQWFLDALATLPEHAETESDGVTIHYRRWGSTARPGLVLVHGGAAHSGWWDHIAPLLAGEYCVVALDLSGHGDSGRRDHYDMETWAREVIAVAEHACLPEPPIIVAHSMGGWVGLTVAADHGDDLAGLILLDSMVQRADPEVEAARVGVAFGPLRVYPTIDAALARFRTVPDQPTPLPYVKAQLGHSSIQITVDTYGRWLPTGDKAFVDALDRPDRQALAAAVGDQLVTKDQFGELPPPQVIESIRLASSAAPEATLRRT